MQKTTFLADSKTVLKVLVCVNINCTFLFAVRTRLLQVAEWAAVKHSGSNKDVNLPRLNADVTRSNPDVSVIHIPGKYSFWMNPIDSKLTFRQTSWNNARCITKYGNLRYAITYSVIWANQKSYFFSITGYAHLHCLTLRAFPPFCRTSDVISSSVDTLIVLTSVYKYSPDLIICNVWHVWSFITSQTNCSQYTPDKLSVNFKLKKLYLTWMFKTPTA